MMRSRKLFHYADPKSLRRQPDEPRYRVRAFHPRGQYPRVLIARPEALYWGDDDLVFCVTLSKRWDQSANDAPFYSEMDWLFLEEIRLIGSLMLCELTDEAPLTFYPIHHYSPILARRTLDLTKQSTAEQIRHLVMREVCGFNTWPVQPHVRHAVEECATHRYHFVEPEQLDLSRQSVIWENIAISDYLLLRGLGALIKSDMLAKYSEFADDSLIACFIALEASFRMVVRKLRSEGMKEPRAKDAAVWLYDHFDKHVGLEAPLERYFQEFYDQRVVVMHPESRFGAFPYALVMHDDYYHLRRAISSIFAYLVSGEHDKGFLAAIERIQGGRD